MKNVYIALYHRTPFTLAHKGSFAKVRSDEFTAQLIQKTIQQYNLDPATLEDLILGCALPEAEQGFNVARPITFLANLPRSIGAMIVNRLCGSSMQAIHIAAGAIQMEAGEAFLCAGMESMSRVPMLGYNPSPHPELAKSYPAAYMGMGLTAENVAKKFNISGEQQNKFALQSHQKAVQAKKSDAFKTEIIPILSPNTQKLIHEDECPREETSFEVLSNLKSAFVKNGTVTAGNSSPLTDGAALTLVCSEKYLKDHKLEPLARIAAIAVSGCDPDIMGIGPIHAVKKLLERTKIPLHKIDIFELNEAFASQSIACIEELKLDHQKINLHGGAIALGHPLGATGARITGKLASLLHINQKKLGISTQCIGGGQGIATLLERP